MTDTTLEMPDGRTLGYADYGSADGVPVLWFHGGPGSRLEPKGVSAEAAALGLRLIGLDRPGYGLSTPRPGRTIASVVPDALAVADALGVEQFFAVGVSTGGAYALATASIAPDRVRGVVACCALTDLRNTEVKQQMVAMTDWSKIFDASSRDEALALAVDQFGEDGSKLADPTAMAEQSISLAPQDEKLFADPTYLVGMLEGLPPMFAWGVEGYADDRLADGPGWGSFDVEAVRCPVVVLHGSADTICPVVNAHATAAIVPGAWLRLTPDDGH
ncbi:MAG TPA: alpha/beta hydrolase, partial [Acidimicrobiales bacterium]|nr:alpha/beta hydrolase [Acidimicrobiales bacterium]